jgi:hypothetical protein
MFWRGWFLVPVLLVGFLIAGGIGAAISHGSWHDDDRGPRVVQVTSPANGSGSATTPHVIEIHDGGWRHHGGFFSGFFLFPLLFFLLIFWLVGGFFRRGWYGGGPGGTWRGHWNDRFEEWHRQQHAGDNRTPPPAASA